MEEIWNAIKKYQKPYIMLVSLIATIILINETMAFAELVKRSILLGLVSLLVFMFLFNIIIEEIHNAK